MEIVGVIMSFLGLTTMLSFMLLIPEGISKESKGLFNICLIGSLLFSLFGVYLIILSKEYEITAIDVYRGNTQLQVNYNIVGNDTIVTDSLVVWK